MQRYLVSRRGRRGVLVASALLAASATLALPARAPASQPVSVQVMVVGKAGRVLVPARRVTLVTRHARVLGRRCQIGLRTPLGALESLAALRGEHHLQPVLAQFAAGCAPNGIYLKSLDREAGKGSGGWCYKLGDRQPEFGVASPEAPRLRTGVRVLFYWCEYSGEEAQPTLDFGRLQGPLRAASTLKLTVYAFATSGKRTPAAKAKVRFGGSAALANEAGEVTLKVPARPGLYRLRATLAGAVPAFERLVRVVGA